MRDKIVLITGANAGIGRETALALAREGACLVLACRRRDKGEAAARDIARASGNAQVSAIVCDLSDFASIQAAAATFCQRFPRLDVLINNAGVYTSRLRKTAQGIEMQFGVNHLGHFLLTALLLDSLANAGQARVVIVSSLMYLRGFIDFENLRGEKGPDAYNSIRAYAQSKLANVLHSRELARRYPELRVNCLHPGSVRSAFINKHAAWYESLGWTLLKPFMISPRRGARTSVYLASAPQTGEVSGRFFDENQRQRNFSSAAADDELAHRRWKVSERLVADPRADISAL
jgi:NAD(P)-dependent dehydrogenase (short-subunit alcohol dehydrogenase family)